MKQSNSIWTGVFAAICMIVLILDTQTAIEGARSGMQLCLSTVIPSLFPFFVLSVLMNSTFTGRRLKVLRPIGRLCGVPDGCESLLLLGLVGGYPIGAQAIFDAFNTGKLCKKEAHRLLGFCNNAGPAFILGMTATLFSSRFIPIIIWMVHIVSALITGMVLPGKSNSKQVINTKNPVSFPRALETGLKAIASVCGWVVLFRVLLAICQRWFLWVIPSEIQMILTGLFELTNGCYDLSSIPTESQRFILCCCFLAAGGLCVLMQTQTVTKDLGVGLYLPGKVIQVLISCILAGILQYFLFIDQVKTFVYITPILILLTIVLYLLYRYKKSSSNMEKAVV